MAIPPPRSRSRAGLHEAGILLVRGIGGSKGAALIACGDTLAHWLRAWFAGRGQGGVRLDDARLMGASGFQESCHQVD